jgi:hypothetical protein
VPVLFGPAAVLAPEVLASPPGEGLLAPMVPLFVVPLPSFIAPSDAPGPTLPWLDAPSLGWAVCAKAVGEASANAGRSQNDLLHLISLVFCLATQGKRPLIAFVATSDCIVQALRPKGRLLIAISDTKRCHSGTPQSSDISLADLRRILSASLRHL